MRFAGSVALVSGAASGIGEAVVRGFVAEGGRALILDSDGARGEALAAELGGSVRLLVADASSEQVAREATSLAVGAFGRLDLVHANAGIGVDRSIAELSFADWERVLAVNLGGAFVLGRAALPHLQASGGSLVFTSSVHALATTPAASAYAASKAGLLGLVRSFAVEGAPLGVRANAVLPGAIDTPMVRSHIEAAPDPAGLERQFASLAPLRRLGTAAEVAAVILFLASPAASFVTGSAYVVDGGLLASLAAGGDG